MMVPFNEAHNTGRKEQVENETQVHKNEWMISNIWQKKWIAKKKKKNLSPKWTRINIAAKKSANI